MGKAKVYFTDLHTSTKLPLVEKMKAVAKAAGIEKIDFKDKFTAIKMHFGEPGNLAFLRPNYAAGMAELVRSLGGKPFLTDANTLYSGGRSNAVDHLDSAMRNGFNRISAGCDVIIADGLKGTECRELPVEGGTYCKTAKIGAAASWNCTPHPSQWSRWRTAAAAVSASSTVPTMPSTSRRQKPLITPERMSQQSSTTQNA